MASGSCYGDIARLAHRAGAPYLSVFRRSFQPWPSPSGLDPRPVLLARDHPRFLAAGFLAFLPSFQLMVSLRGIERGLLPPFEFFGQLGPCDQPVDRLVALPLAAHLLTGRQMTQPHGRRSLVDFLPAGPGPANKTFLDVPRLYAQRDKSRAQRRFYDVGKIRHALF